MSKCSIHDKEEGICQRRVNVVVMSHKPEISFMGPVYGLVIREAMDSYYLIKVGPAWSIKKI